MLAIASSTCELICLMSDLHEVFDIMDLSDVHWLLGISIVHDRAAQTVALSQTSHIKTITRCFHLETTHDI